MFPSHDLPKELNKKIIAILILFMCNFSSYQFFAVRHSISAYLSPLAPERPLRDLKISTIYEKDLLKGKKDTLWFHYG